MEVRVGTMRERQREVQLYRGQIPSPGRPTVAWREDRVRFWAAIARGLKTEDAGVEAGVSSPVAYRWFRHAGGVNPCSSSDGLRPLPVVRRARGHRDLARPEARCARDRPTSGPEPVDDLARAASQRVDADLAVRLQGVHAQWHAERRARRPKLAKLVHERAAARLRPGAAVRRGADT